MKIKTKDMIKQLNNASAENKLLEISYRNITITMIYSGGLFMRKQIITHNQFSITPCILGNSGQEVVAINYSKRINLS